LYHICKVKNRIQREKQITQSDQDVHVYGLWWTRLKLLLCDLSPSIKFSESIAIPSFFFSFFQGPSWALFFPFIQYLDLPVSIFF
jgi:hypothetical protein